MGKAFASVLIDTYNHEKFIEQAIVSALEQDFPADQREVIVVDDGSTDRTPEIVAKFAPHVRHLRKTNGGQASAFNAGIAECRGEIIAFLDGDDWWEAEKLATVAREFEANAEIGAVGHGFYEVDETGRREYVNVPDRGYKNSLKTRQEAQEFIELRSFLGTSRVAVRKNAVEKILPIPEALVIEADEYLSATVAARDGAMVLDKSLTNYRIHGGNLYQSDELDEKKLWRKFEVMRFLAGKLADELKRLGVAREGAEFLRQSNWLDSERIRLMLGKGWPWDSVRAEWLAYRMRGEARSVRERLFRFCVLASAAVTPPGWFYGMRRQYSARGAAQAGAQNTTSSSSGSLVVRRAQN